MSDSPPNYRRLFWTSRHHLWLALLTVGLGFASGQPLGLLAGATLYAVGLVFGPDLPFFRRSITAKQDAVREQEAAAQLVAFQKEHERLSAALSPARRTRLSQLGSVCQDIERASGEMQRSTGLDLPTPLRKLDELLWTYLRMLSVEQSLEVYLETERKEQVPALAASISAETDVLAREIEALKTAQPASPLLESKQRLLTSRLERAATLRQRLARIEQAQANHDLVRSEQERLVEQVKLIRADAIAAKNSDALSARIDTSIEHLSATNRWLSELDEYQSVTRELPDLPVRLVPGATPTPSPTPQRTAPPQRQ